nr:MDR family MFS transporter [Isoptericola sp. AK164]
MHSESSAPSPSSRPVPRRRSRRGVVPMFAGLLTGMMLSSLSQTIFATALPTIVGELRGVDQMLWVTTAYILAATVVVPVYGKLGDLVGRKGLFVAAIGIFVAGSLAGGFAGSMPVLVAARAVQGLGGGGLIVLAQAIVAEVVPARQRGKYLGIMGAGFAVSSVAGPLLGGWFTEGPGWRWGLWVNVPLGLAAIVLASVFLQPSARRPERPRIDVAGMTLLALTTTALVLITSFGGRSVEWVSLPIGGLAALAVVAGVAFVLVERRAVEPVIPLRLFSDRTFCLVTTAALLTGVSMFGVLGYMPTYLQMVGGVDATEAGLLTTPMMLLMLVTSTVAGALVSRTGRYRAFPVAGSGVMAVALLLLSTLEPGTSVRIACGYLALFGVGLGLTTQILVLIVQNAFALRIVGTATAATNYFRQVGASIGTAVVGSLFTARLTTLLAERLPPGATTGPSEAGSFTPAAVAGLPGPTRDVVTTSYADAMTPVFLVLLPLALVAAVLLLFVREAPLRTTLDEEVGGGATGPDREGGTRGTPLRSLSHRRAERC